VNVPAAALFGESLIVLTSFVLVGAEEDDLGAQLGH